MNKIKEAKSVEALERKRPPSYESEMIVRSVKGTLYLEEFKTFIPENGLPPRKRTRAQKGIGNIAIKCFKFIGSLN